MRVALTIAGSDSSGGAGIQADLKTFAALGVYGASAITAITAQSTVGVVESFALPADLVAAQIEAVAGDIDIQATKTGMLADAAIVEAVAAAVESFDLPNLVVDPVMVAKGGDRLLDDDAVHTMRSALLRLARVVTPNVPEAEVLSGMAIHSLDDMREAGHRILRLGPRAVIVKGGHLAGATSPDLLISAGGETLLDGPRLAVASTHGTGCTFASAIAACLARGAELPAAVQEASDYVAGAIAHGLAIGRGHGPLDHFWALRPPK